jgi:hypothetical protein
VHIPSQDALLAMPDNHLHLLHMFLTLVVDQMTDGVQKGLPHGETAGSMLLVSVAVQGLVQSCQALGWDSDLHQEGDVPIHLYLAGRAQGLVPRVTVGTLNTWAHTEGMSAHSVLQFQSILLAIEAAKASRRTLCTQPA